MALESAKCPNCGAAIQVPNEREDTFCAYCGSQIKTRAAIGYFQVKLKGKVQIDNDPAVQAKLRRGRETGDIKYFKDALDLDPDCYEARKATVKYDLSDNYGFHLFERIQSVFYISMKPFSDSCNRKYSRILKGKDPLPPLVELWGKDFFSLTNKDMRDIVDNAIKSRLPKERGQNSYLVNDIWALRCYCQLLKAFNQFNGVVEEILEYCAVALYIAMKANPFLDRLGNRYIIDSAKNVVDQVQKY